MGWMKFNGFFSLLCPSGGGGGAGNLCSCLKNYL